MIAIASSSQQRCEHRLQSSDEIVGLFVALQKRGDLGIFHFDLVAIKILLLAQERVLPFKHCDHARRVGLGRAVSRRDFFNAGTAVGRAWSRRVGRLQWLGGLGDRVRHALRRRAASDFVAQPMKLRELFDRALDRNRIDEIGEAGCVSSLMQSRRPAAQ